MGVRAALGEEGEATVSGQGSGESRWEAMGSSAGEGARPSTRACPAGWDWFSEVLMGTPWPTAWPGATVLMGPGGGHPASLPVLRGRCLLGGGGLGWQPQPLF